MSVTVLIIEMILAMWRIRNKVSKHGEETPFNSKEIFRFSLFKVETNIIIGVVSRIAFQKSDNRFLLRRRYRT
jgi:hypothetical protein